MQQSIIDFIASYNTELSVICLKLLWCFRIPLNIMYNTVITYCIFFLPNIVDKILNFILYSMQTKTHKC